MLAACDTPPAQSSGIPNCAGVKTQSLQISLPSVAGSNPVKASRIQQGVVCLSLTLPEGLRFDHHINLQKEYLGWGETHMLNSLPDTDATIPATPSANPAYDSHYTELFIQEKGGVFIKAATVPLESATLMVIELGSPVSAATVSSQTNYLSILFV